MDQTSLSHGPMELCEQRTSELRGHCTYVVHYGTPYISVDSRGRVIRHSNRFRWRLNGPPALDPELPRVRPDIASTFRELTLAPP